MRRHRHAFTLMEVLVAVVLLTLMVLIVSTILSQSSRVATLTEVKIRQNNAAAALSQAFREYFYRASKVGVLCITDADAAGTHPRLVLTTVGPSLSITGNGKGTAAFTLVGLVPNQARSGDSNSQLLWMPTYVLTQDASASGDDVWTSMGDLARLQSNTRRQINDNIITSCVGAVSNLAIPPRDLTEVGRTWQIGATGVSRLSIMWTDGNCGPTGGLLWFGRDLNGNVSCRDSAWASRTAADLDNNPDSVIEYSAGGNLYRALWTLHNQNSWPKAIKVRFTLTDPSVPNEFQSTDYEVIGTIGQ